MFLNLEDETGMVNVICSPGAWERWRHAARRSPALLVRGRLERVDGVVSVVAEKITPLDLGSLALQPSRATSGSGIGADVAKILKGPTHSADM